MPTEDRRAPAHAPTSGSPAATPSDSPPAPPTSGSGAVPRAVSGAGGAGAGGAAEVAAARAVAGGGVAVGQRPGDGGGLPAAPAPWRPTPPPPLFASWWPAPPEPARRVVAGALLVGMLAAATIGGFPHVGINVPAVALVAVGVVAQVPRREAVSVPLVVIALGLAGVAGVRDSGWLVAGCIVAAVCLAAVAVLDLRRWDDLLGAVPLLGAAVGRALPWAARSRLVAGSDAKQATPWAAGLAITLIFMIVVGGLLASADAEFADLVWALLSAFSLGILPLRAVAFGVVTAFVLGLAFAVSARPRTRQRAQRTRPAHPAEWLLPVLGVGATLAVFLAVNARQLFDGADLVRQEAGVSHSERAVAGFWQLVAVTLIVIGLLSWAGARAAAGPPLHRRLMTAGGGALLLLALLLAGSALRRVQLYQDAYGWTVLRLNGAAVELWLIVVLLGAGAAWTLRRTALIPRFVAGSAGLGLLVTALLGPDAVVADANVDRWERSGKIDTAYVFSLSADAAPARSRLPESLHPCARFGEPTADDPWYRWNLSRSRATALADVRCDR